MSSAADLSHRARSYETVFMSRCHETKRNLLLQPSGTTYVPESTVYCNGILRCQVERKWSQYTVRYKLGLPQQGTVRTAQFIRTSPLAVAVGEESFDAAGSRVEDGSCVVPSMWFRCRSSGRARSSSYSIRAAPAAQFLHIAVLSCYCMLVLLHDDDRVTEQPELLVRRYRAAI